jgi:hypothetical protein
MTASRRAWRPARGARCGLVALAVSTPAVAVGAQTSLPVDARSIGGWRASATVGETWQSNVRFVPDSTDPELTTRARVEAARLWQSARNRVTMIGSGSRLRFQNHPDLDRSAYDGTLQATRALSARTNAALDYRLRSDYTNRVLTAGGEGALRGLIAARTNDVAATLGHRLSAATQVRVSGNYQTATFDAPDLSNGSATAAAIELDRRQSRATTWTANYDARRSSAGNRIVDVQQLRGAWEHRLGRYVRTRLASGVSLTRLDSSSRQSPTFVGDGVLYVQGERGTFDGQYTRSVGQEYGLDSAIVSTTDALSLRYRVTLGRAFHLESSARQAWTDGSFGSVRRVRSTEGTIELRYGLRSGIAIGASAFVRRRAERLVTLDRGVTLGVGFGWSQIRSMPANPDPDLQ